MYNKDPSEWNFTRMEGESNRTLPVQCNPCIHRLHRFRLFPINLISPQTGTGFVMRNVLCICHRGILNKYFGSCYCKTS